MTKVNFITYKLLYLVVKGSNSPPLESKIVKKLHAPGYKFEYFDQTEIKSVVLIMIKDNSRYAMMNMANMISPKVGLTSSEIAR